MSRLAVLHIAPLPPPYGGMATYFQQFRDSKIWSLCRHDVVRMDYLNKNNLQGINRFFVNILNCFIVSWMLIYRTLSFHAEIIHIQTNSGAGFFEKSMFAVLGRLLGRKVLLHVHGGGFRQRYINYPAFLKWIVRCLLKAPHGIIVATPQMNETFLMVGISPDKIRLLPNAINLPDLTQYCPVEKTNTGPKAINILFLNRIERAKGIQEFIDVAIELCMEYSDITFRIAGACDKSEMDNLYDVVKRKNMVERIKLLGKLTEEQKHNQLYLADIYALPSYVEDLPYGLIEAMAYGIACVGSDVGGIPSLLEDGKSGLLCRPQDKISLREKIETLIKNEELRQVLGKNARKRIEQHFNWQRRAEEFEKVYKEVLKS